MAKGIRERLLEQAIKFHQWQEATYPGKTSEELGGEWEVDYPYWNDTYSAFCHVLTQMDAETADSVLLDEMVYLIARDNEAEGFITCLVPLFSDESINCILSDIQRIAKSPTQGELREEVHEAAVIFLQNRLSKTGR